MEFFDPLFLVSSGSSFGMEILQKVLAWLIGLSISAGVVWFLAYREMIGKSFFGRITFSYIGLEDGENSERITIDTLLDKHLSDVWLNNRILLRSIVSCAQQCNESTPLLVPEKHHLYHVTSGLRHQISERYSDGLIDRALGFEIRKEELLIALCFSASKADGVQKLRALVLHPQILKKIGEQTDAFEKANPKQIPFIKALQAAYKRWQQEENDPKLDRLITKVRVYRRK